MTPTPHHVPHVDEHVRLKMDIPQLGLHSGEQGSVCSTWFSDTAFEVEFRNPEMPDCPIRAVVREEQLEADEPEPGTT